MKFPNSNLNRRSAGILPAGNRARFFPASALAAPKRSDGGFTMIEIAISLAIVGFALVAIIGVLPYGMNTQRDNREETVINQDASVLIETIRSGAYGYDDLTNNVIAITNTWTAYNADGTANSGGVRGYTYDAAFNNLYLTNGARIIGLLSTPQFTGGLLPGGNAVTDIFGNNYVSNHVTAYVRSLSGLAAEKPPQPSDSMLREDSFTYRLYVVNAPMPQNTNNVFKGFDKQLAANQRELRLAFSWPVQPNGTIGSGRHTYRSTIGGQLVATNYNGYGQTLYFYQPQSFKSQ
jgi:prepilin-type N-terminal cleavage/methylation domain-containing protein